ncbi:MAG TPA: hypothetical protein VK053_04555, partial [Jiangellaceae bacterium]|nr:hypothetical protein [Jiangellaceae bacterium]
LVERMSGFTGLLAVPSKHAEPTADAVIEYFNALPEMMRASLAWDQGSEMAQHAKVSLATSMPVYFADPHSPWPRDFMGVWFRPVDGMEKGAPDLE